VLRPLIDLAHRQGAAPRFDPSAGRVVQHVFLRRGKLLSNGFLFDLALRAACTAAGLLDPLGHPTVSAHRFRHTIGTALAEGGARLQTIMAVLGHRTPAMSLIYASLSDPVVKQEYADALTRNGGGGIRLAGPAAEALRSYRLDPAAVHWLQTNFLKTELELGHCLRLPQEGPCECDLVLTCAKFVTTDAYAPGSPSNSSSSTMPTPAAGRVRSNATRPPSDASRACSSTSRDTLAKSPRPARRIRHPDRSSPLREEWTMTSWHAEW